MTTTATEASFAHSTISNPKDAAPARPSRAEVEKAIRDEASRRVHCNRKMANQLVEMLKKATKQVRRSGGSYALSLDEWVLTHEVLEVVMPGKRMIAPPGSTHELINRYFATGNELGLIHTRDGDEPCVIMISVEKA